MSGLFDLTGKVAVVTGGNGGIGGAQAEGLAEAGADVVLVDKAGDNFGQITGNIRSKGRKALAFTADITREAPVREIVEEVLKEFSRIDILINAAGITIRKPADTFPVDEWQRVMDVNSRGTFVCCKLVGAVMVRQKGGKIINLSSVRGRYGLPFDQAAYCTSKGAVDALTRTLACEWAKYNVLVNALAPTVIETNFTKAGFSDPKMTASLRDRIPLGRWGITADIIGPTIFFASRASDFITGQILYVDGGHTTW